MNTQKSMKDYPNKSGLPSTLYTLEVTKDGSHTPEFVAEMFNHDEAMAMFHIHMEQYKKNNSIGYALSLTLSHVYVS